VEGLTEKLAFPFVFAALGYDTVDLAVVAHLPAFPGMGPNPMYVAPAEPVFAQLGVADPRLRPRSLQAPR